MANRLATQADVDNTIYSDWIIAEGLPPMLLNDIIIDVQTNTGGIVYYNDFSSSFSGARSGATIWIDSINIALTTNISSMGITNTTEWDNGFMTIRPLRGQCHFIRNSSNNAGAGYISLNKFKYIAINGEMNSYPGYRNPTSIFMSGTFGFRGSSIINNDAFNGVSLTNTESTESEIYIAGFEVEHGFAGFRIGIGNTATTEIFRKVVIERCYRHDSISGEGSYLGYTGSEGDGFPSYREFTFANNGFIRTATEANQIQHPIDLAIRSTMKNCIAIGGVDWIAPFGGGQDNSLQITAGDGNIRIEDNIYDGTGFSFLFMTSATGSITTPQTDKIRHRNNLLVNGKAYGGYIHSPSTLGLEYEWIKNYFIKFNDWYEDILSENAVTAIYAKAGAATDDVSFVDNIKDTTRAAWFNEADSSIDLIDNAANDDTLLLPNYEQTGIDYTKYKGIWTASKGDAGSLYITWTLDDIVTVFTNTIGTRFYKCILGHTSNVSSNPVADTSEWTHMTWDEAGIRIDEVGWASGDTQSNLPPDNFTLSEDELWNKLGMGLSHSVAPTIWSKFKWYYADDAIGTNKVQILYEKEATIDLTIDGNAWLALKTGKYLLSSVTPVDSLGNIGDEVFATGIVIGDGSVAPVLLTQTVENATPTDVVMVFSKIVTGTNLGFTLSGTTETTFASMSGFGTDTLTGVLATAVLGTETPLLNYSSISGDIVDVDSTPLASFSNKIIQNNVFTVPVVESMIVNNSNANEWIVNFDVPVTNTTIAGWSFKIDGVVATITGVAGTGTAQLTFTVTETVLTGEVLLSSYDSNTGNCVAVNGGLELVLFTDASVVNNVGATKIDIVWDNGTITPIPPNTGINVFPLVSSSPLTNLVDQNNVETVLSIQRTLGSPASLATGATCTDARWDAAMSLESDYTGSSVTYTISGLGASEVVDLSIFSSIATGGTMAYWLQGVKQTEFNCGSNTAVKVYTGIIANASGEITVEIDEILGTAFASINCLGIDIV